MPSDVAVTPDRFASALSGILTDADGNLRRGAKAAVRAGAKVAKAEWRSGAPRDRGKYARSISMTVRDGSEGPTAEVGSKSMPGLPHLLEKGHAMVGGGRTRAFVHIAPAADDGFDETMRRIGEVEL